jgi:signal transduction histidine kinase
LILNFLIKTNNETSHILKYIILSTVSLLIITLVSTTNHSLWITSEIHHFYLELFGTIFAGILAFYYISRAHTFNDKFSLFIGIGFLVNALIDLVHVIISFLNMDEALSLNYFMSQTWFAGRLFLSAMLAMAFFKFASFSSSTNFNKQQQQQQEILFNKKKIDLKSILFYFIIITSLAVATSSLFVIFPFSVIDGITIHRPYEIFPLVLFLFIFYYFFKNKIYKNRDIVYISLVISIVFNIFGQIIMSYSINHFDTAHNMAHVLKDVSYFINIIGLALSSIHYNIKLKESNEILSQQYEKVKESEKMKSEFLNIAAHELRIPIQPILGLTDVIYSTVQDKEQQELLQIVMRNAKRLKRLTDDMLDITKIENCSLMLKKEKLNLNILISEILNEYEKKEVKQQLEKIVYGFKNKDDSIIIEADRDRLVQIIRNLVDNALKFNMNNYPIFVIVDKMTEEGNEEKVIVSVKDTGKGISKEILPKLFSKFTTSDSSKGTGLGLYICKSIVEAHGGEIWAENNLDGNKGGATFSFKLPISRKN